MRWRDQHGNLRPLDHVFREHLGIVRHRLAVRTHNRLERRALDALEPTVIIRGSVGPSSGEREFSVTDKRTTW